MDWLFIFHLGLGFIIRLLSASFSLKFHEKHFEDVTWFKQKKSFGVPAHQNGGYMFSASEIRGAYQDEQEDDRSTENL